MEDKLESYRLRKRRKERYETFKKKIIEMIPFYRLENENATIVDIHKSPDEEETTNTGSPACSELDEDFVSEDDETIFPKKPKSEPDPILPTNKYVRYGYWLILLLFWLTCFAIAVELKFGIVYILFSCIFGIYFNTRTEPKQRGEISAYSVFNKDCHSIDGTLKAEQFEREIRYGAASVH